MATSPSNTSRQNASQIFAPFRSVGFVSNHIPLDLEAKGLDHFVTTVVGRSYQTYNCKMLKLTFVGESLPEEISAISHAGAKAIVASGQTVAVYRRGRRVNSYNGHDSQVILLLVLGDHVISIDDSNNIHVWSHVTLDVHLSFSLSIDDFKVSACAHPSTYLNKILFGSKQGALQLWNVRTQKLIYEFKGWKEPVVALEQSPAVGVVGIGLQSGRIILHNIKYDKTLMSFYQEFGLVTSITFRTDGPPIMATGSTLGHISLWDLEKKAVLHIERDAHAGSVTGMKFFQKEPLLITSSPDNSLKIWIFDNSDGSCRLLKSRCGHSGTPNHIVFYGSFGNAILTAGMDKTLRYTGIMRGEQCYEFSQGSLVKRSKSRGIDVEKLRLPPVTCIAAEPSKEKDWDNVVTCHLGHSSAITWNALKRSIGKYKLNPKENCKQIPTAVDVSSCGNFCIIGYKNGSLVKFNLQSGLERGGFLNEDFANATEVRGVSIDNANVKIISTHADGTIKFWNFKDIKELDSVKCDCPVTKSKLHRGSSLLAVALDDFTIQIYDIDTKNMVRQFYGHKNLITDISWSSDARWLVSSAMDGTIKTWDVPSARLIDCFLVEDSAISVAFSPSGEFLASTHQDNVGIYLWSNKVMYSGVYPTPLPNEFQPVSTISMPITQTEIDESSTELRESLDVEMGNEEVIDEYKSPDQLGVSLITLSTLPESRWKTLINLDLIKERNKPKQPPKKPKVAPFFLPTATGVETRFDMSKNTEEDGDGLKLNSKVMNMGSFGSDTSFQQLIKVGGYTANACTILDMMKSMSPSQTDVELRCLGPDAGGTLELLCAAVKLFVALLKTGKDYELVQAYIALFLKLHGDVVYREENLRNEAEFLLNELKDTWNTCNVLANQSSCVVKYFKSATV